MHAVPWRRRLAATWRDTRLLLRQFRGPLLAFSICVLGSGLLYFHLARRAGLPLSGYSEAVYLVLTLAFLQPAADFPPVWYLQIFYFLLPIVGLGLLAQGLADFGTMLFNRRARTKEWEMAVSSTYRNHTILVGLGHLGYRVVKHLLALKQDVVVIEINPQKELVSTTRSLGVPVLEEDASQESALLAAGIRRARTIVLCTQNDSLNLQVAVKARSLNPQIQVVVRIFDDDFAQALDAQFGFHALSATGMAAPVFAAAAAGVEMTHPLMVEGTPLSLAHLTVEAQGTLPGRAVREIERDFNLSVVLLRRNGRSDLHPGGGRRLRGGDQLGVLGDPNAIGALVRANQPPPT